MITVKCPSCQTIVSGPERLCGKKVQCGKCKTVFLFPQTPAQAAPRPAAPQPTPQAAHQPAPRPAAPPAATRPAAQQAAKRPDAPHGPDDEPKPKTRKAGLSKGAKKSIMLSIMAIMLLSLAGLAVYVVPKMMARSSPDIVKRYASNETFAVGKINVENLVLSDLYTRLGLDQLVKDAIKDFPTKLKPEDLAKITIMIDRPLSDSAPVPSPMIVISVNRDMPLKDMVDSKAGAMIKKIQGVEYISLSPQSVLAKTDPATVCLFLDGGVSALTKLVSDLKANRTAKLDNALKASIARVSGNPSFFAVHVPQSMKDKIPAGMPIPPSIADGAMGFAVGSDVKFQIAAAFGKDDDAKNASMTLGMAKAAGVGFIRGKAMATDDKDIKAVLTAAANTLDAVKVTRQGKELRVEANIAGQDIVLVKENFAKLVGSFLAAPSGPADPDSGGKPAANPLGPLMGIFGK